MAAVGVSTITTPERKSVRGEDIVQFDLAYERYVRQIAEINIIRTASQCITEASMKACVSAELLISLTMLRTFPGCLEVSDVSDEDVKTSIKERSRCSVDDMASHVKDAVARVTFRPDKSDRKRATLEFFTDVLMKLRRNRVSNAITDASRALITLLMPKLEPTVLRESIQCSHDYWPKKVKYNFHHFMKKVSEISVQSAKYDRKRERNEKPFDDKQKHQGHEKTRLCSSSVSKEHHKPGVKQGVTNSSSGAKQSGKSNLKCLNPKCDKYHLIRDCEDTIDADKEKLLRDYREKMKRKNGSKMAALREADASDGRWATVTEDTVNCTTLGDIGAYESAVPISLIEEIKKKGQSINVIPLDKVIHLSPAVELPKSLTITATAKALLSITISLPYGPLRLLVVEFLIVD